jgi:uridine kinase
LPRKNPHALQLFIQRVFQAVYPATKFKVVSTVGYAGTKNENFLFHSGYSIANKKVLVLDSTYYATMNFIYYTTMLIQELADKLSKMPRQSKTLLVAIDGHGGSGKSLFATYLKTSVELAGSVATIIPLDGFSRKKTEDDYIALKDYPEVRTPYRIDTQRLTREVLLPLRSNKAAVYTKEDWWDKNKASQQTIPLGGVVIIEGCYALMLELRPFYDFSILIDIPKSQSKEQAIKRDIGLGADPRTNPLLWEEIYYPQEERYMAATKPHKATNLIITKFNEKELNY